jgi:hypothetical protein
MASQSCPECGVPEIITSEHVWLNNGDIVSKRDQSNRLGFTETQYLDPLFRGIEQIIGMPIEHMVITAVRRAVHSCLKAFVPPDVREKIRLREIEYKPIVDSRKAPDFRGLSFESCMGTCARC